MVNYFCLLWHLHSPVYIYIHMDDCSNPDTQKFLDLLDSFDLQQHVKQPTHRDGHTLDLSITHKLETLVKDDPTVDLFISDHAAVLTRLVLSRPGSTLRTTWMRLSVNTIPPYQHCLINTHHLKHAEELSDLSYPGTMNLSTMLSDSGRRPNANGERQRLLMISLISSQRETM